MRACPQCGRWGEPGRWGASLCRLPCTLVEVRTVAPHWAQCRTSSPYLGGAAAADPVLTSWEWRDLYSREPICA